MQLSSKWTIKASENRSLLPTGIAKTAHSGSFIRLMLDDDRGALRKSYQVSVCTNIQHPVFNGLDPVHKHFIGDNDFKLKGWS